MAIWFTVLWFPPNILLPILAILIWSALLQIGIGRIVSISGTRFGRIAATAIVLLAATLSSTMLVGRYLARIDDDQVAFVRNIQRTFYGGNAMEVTGLAAHGYNVDHVSWCGTPPLYNVSDPSALHYLAKRRLVADPSDPAVSELLFVYVQTGSGHCVKALVDAGANVNSRHQTTGQTPLDFADAKKRPYIAQALKDAGAVTAVQLSSP